MNPQAISVVSLDNDLIDELKRSDHFEVFGVFDKQDSEQHFSVPWIGNDEIWRSWRKAHPDVMAVLATDQPKLKMKVLHHYDVTDFLNYTSPYAYVSASARIGQGSVVQRHADISSNVTVGNFVKVNIVAKVAHDCMVGHFSTLAPNCTLLGNVRLGEGVYVGCSATILPRVKVGDGAIIGAGAVVTRDVDANTTVVGVPARDLRRES